eukprot:CAMPEP_0117439966 /NCGR_PEP_ID=MMETSP0759-20121206/2833_1 /TAXON_ID=63605 /ORGANISM="Percolomonas cosmopolitus, Strain WS" /LENGTH=486 /DNA_ID=CAMNT_0005231689 /DNA_START=34 /DNA_END=1494 /DNA_ORIENTATION=+
MPPRDDFIEQQYILRIPPELATRVQNLVIDAHQERLKEKRRDATKRNHAAGSKSSSRRHSKPPSNAEPSLNVQFDSDRHGTLVFSYTDPKNPDKTLSESYECLIVDMPTVIESYKSLDLETYYKCGQVAKMVLVTTDEFERKQRERMKHWIEGDSKGRIRKEGVAASSSSSGNAPFLPPHMQHQHLNEQKKEKEREEQRNEQQRKQDNERRRKQRELFERQSELTPHIYHSGLTPSLQNIYEHWEKTKITVTKEEVDRMMQNYYVQMFDEKDFVIEKVDKEESGSVSTPGGTTTTTTSARGGPGTAHHGTSGGVQRAAGTTTTSTSSRGGGRALSPSPLDEIDEQMDDMLSLSDERSDASDDELSALEREMMEEGSDEDMISDDDASSASFDDTRSSASDDMMDESPDVQNQIVALGREKSNLLRMLNAAKNEAKQHQQQLGSVGGNPMLRAQAQTALERKTQQIQEYNIRIQEVNTKMKSLQGKR